MGHIGVYLGMMFYEDKTFCKSDCTNAGCYRFFSEQDRQGARAWMGEDAPIAWADFSGNCEEYLKP